MAERVDCLYRVSTTKQVDHDELNQADIPVQRKACRDFAEKMGWVIVNEEQETGVSGYKVSANDRDKLQLIKKRAEQGKFDILLVFMFDRLGRKSDETPFVVEQKRIVSDKIKVLVAEPEKPCQVQEISDTLEAIQAVVGGEFEAVFPFDGSTAVVCNRDGKIDGLPFNRPLLDDSGQPYDILCGTFFITGVRGENFVSLTDDQIRRYKELYDNVMVVPDKGDPDVGRITHVRPLGTKKPSVKNKAENER